MSEFSVRACLGPGLFVDMDAYDSPEDARKGLPEIAEMVHEVPVFYTYDGKVIMTDKILFLEVGRI